MDRLLYQPNSKTKPYGIASKGTIESPKLGAELLGEGEVRGIVSVLTPQSQCDSDHRCAIVDRVKSHRERFNETPCFRKLVDRQLSGDDQPSEGVRSLISEQKRGMQILAGIKPRLKLPFDRIGAWVIGRQDDGQVGIDNGRHLQSRPRLGFVASRPNKLHHVDRFGTRQPLSQGCESVQHGQAGPPSLLRGGIDTSETGTEIARQQRGTRNSQSLRL